MNQAKGKQGRKRYSAQRSESPLAALAPNPPPPTPMESEAIASALKNQRARGARFEIAMSVKNDVLQIGSPHGDEAGFAARLHDCFGTTSPDFQNQAVGRLGAIMRRKGEPRPTQTALNAALAAVDGARPKDEIEAMLAMQMIATHETALDMLTRAKQADYMPTLQECGSLAVKLLRTYAAQVEALGRLRRGGEQRVIVQHVTVKDGGQAIVGAVNRPGEAEK